MHAARPVLVACALAASFAALALVAPTAAQQPTLRQTIHQDIMDGRWIPYSSNIMTDTWDVISLADADPITPTNVLTLYGNASFPRASARNDDWEREHLWPQSYGTDDETACGFAHNDVHHIFASEPSLNQSRSNLPFDDCTAPDCVEKGAGNRMRGNDRMTVEQSGTWEVWPERRGDVARAVLYMDVRYEGGVHPGTDCAEPDLVLTDDRALLVTVPTTTTLGHMGILSTVLRWHQEDPVDDRERHRNNVIEAAQGNRNPFIDHPEWVCQVWACPPPDSIGGKGTDPLYLPHASLNAILIPATNTPPPTATPAPTDTPRPTETPPSTDTPPPSATPTPTRTPANTATPTTAPTMPPTATAAPTSPGPADLRIAVLQCAGRDEYVRVVNDGGTSVNLSGWRIRSVVGPQTFDFPSYTLDPGATVSVHSGPDAPPTGGNVLRWTTAYIWNNDGDSAELRDPQGIVVDDRDC